MTSVFDISNFNLVLDTDLVENRRYYIVDIDDSTFEGVYQNRSLYGFTFLETGSNTTRFVVDIGELNEFYQPKPRRVKRSDKAS